MSPELPALTTDQFQYDLPDEQIARFPLSQRDQSKLLVYKHGAISHHTFSELPSLIPTDSFLIFNQTKVIPARLIFTRATGTVIELFLLNPADIDGKPRLIAEAMQDKSSAVWQCMIGNRKRWREGETLVLALNDAILIAEWANPDQNEVRFNWQPADYSFAEIVQLAGQMPLPPYLKRDAIPADRQTYQTVYAKQEGAVAAPTAGLHFTKEVFAELANRNIGHDALTLHVGAGTFQPIKTDDVRAHTMHAEQVIYTQANLEQILAHVDHILPVGTTSMRSLESLYWFGVRLLRQEENPFWLSQEYAYEVPVVEQPEAAEAVKAVLDYMHANKLASLTAHTAVYITPGYQMKLCRGIITNFHQPGSTLIVLISALVGPVWRTIYTEALEKGYRFLSYGDSSLLLP
ncbi:S-adenosylmethionine:tRNA ribosyltransferase-isomerase [Fibrella sp. HMF5335]|uniref:S-adenosylmethionine:tRNA ribosyltransferase-isomerase n=1 Tax=Fibrella rubiginis TaxID=2817060 RepID=A0A939GJ62_9BACT|nr:S-adenosylmethionine:tRNA ribosyltransferase-isomerase [Fibrella rubiginis]MBO0937397.1 S-adenosylmethionine:tRNA ribosyltransferase-isomerase [Fibrella rubiginis]